MQNATDITAVIFPILMTTILLNIFVSKTKVYFISYVYML